ncbi:MAG TPA: hypothetical protein VK714_02640 [Myxococcota bacterium]|nr:hypothetical protein [Myxococcota bacterium]
MRPQELLRALEARGVRIRVLEDGRLGVDPASVLTEELRAAVRVHRDELRELVKAKPRAPIDELDEDWRTCKVRAREGYARAGTRPPVWGLDGATALELDLLDRRRILEAVYAGRLVAILGTDGRAVVFRHETGGSA